MRDEKSIALRKERERHTGAPLCRTGRPGQVPTYGRMLNCPLPAPQGPAKPGTAESLELKVGGANPIPCYSSIGAVSRGNRRWSGPGDCNPREAAGHESRVQHCRHPVRSAINTKPLGGFPRGLRHSGLNLSATCAGSPRLAAPRAKCRPLRPMPPADRQAYTIRTTPYRFSSQE